MIAVIADDFTGAAEIGGVGIRYGLKVIIETKVYNEVDAELLIIAADTRNMDPLAASNEIKNITKLLMLQNPEYIYKKIDSVFRGNVGEELEAQMCVSNKNRCIIIAGNPSINRFIKKGIYYFDNQPLAETSFSKDREYKIKSSYVLDLVHTRDVDVCTQSVNSEVPEEGLIIGDVTNLEDMNRWQHQLDDKTIAAGGAGFFNVLLSSKYNRVDTKIKSEYTLGDNTLFILGSAFAKKKHFLDCINLDKYYVSNMPVALYWRAECEEKEINSWSNEMISQLHSGKSVIVTIDHSGNEATELASKLKEIVGKAVFNVLQKVNVRDILIEGGATASVIFKYLKITRLFPFEEIEPGVIQMKASGYPNMYITTKPGSYKWPDTMLNEKKSIKNA